MKKINLLLWLCFAQSQNQAQVTTVMGGALPGPNGICGAAQQLRVITLPPFNYQPPAAQAQPLKETVYKFAEPVATNINLLQGNRRLKNGNWVFAVKIRVPNALSLSLHFDRFYLPEGAEMYLYNSTGSEITGPVTSKENNSSGYWGSDVYEGDAVTVEVSVPNRPGRPASLHIKSIGCGFAPIAQQANRFGASGDCNVNVNCPAGTGWDAEKRSVALILDPYGGSWTGVLLNNTCQNRIPYVLTAAHAALNDRIQPIAKWRFVFNYWSNTCTPSIDGSQRQLLNGAVLKAYSTWTDFALLQLEQTPDQFSGIVYAGWDRTSTPYVGAMGLHHPAGDVMKLAVDNGPIERTNYPSLVGNVYWQADWQLGVTETGSSGSPLFNMQRKVIGQLRGGYSFCGSGNKKDYYGAFDVSWLGSGSPASRLRDWLDPQQTGEMTINSLSAGYYAVAGPDQLCATGTYSIANLPPGATVSWQPPTPGGIVSLSTSGNTATLTRLRDGTVGLTAVVTICGHSFTVTKTHVQSGAYPMQVMAAQQSCSDVTFTATGNAPVASYHWSVATGDLLFENGSATITTSLPYANAVGSYGTVAVSTNNSCGGASAVYADYFPYRREFSYGMYQPILNGESLVATIAPVAYANEYRWYLNGQLVQSGASTLYSTNDPNLLQCGSNALGVEAVTDCGIVNVAYDSDIQRACGNTFRNNLSATIFPNPATDWVRVELKAEGAKQPGIQAVNVYDKLGMLKKRLVVKGTQQSVLLQIGDLPEGIYFVELTSEGGTIKQKLSIKR
jgi:lysyl endopeptidase